MNRHPLSAFYLIYGMCNSPPNLQFKKRNFFHRVIFVSRNLNDWSSNGFLNINVAIFKVFIIKRLTYAFSTLLLLISNYIAVFPQRNSNCMSPFILHVAFLHAYKCFNAAHFTRPKRLIKIPWVSFQPCQISKEKRKLLETASHFHLIFKLLCDLIARRPDSVGLR